jgi:hypothetical protein
MLKSLLQQVWNSMRGAGAAGPAPGANVQQTPREAQEALLALLRAPMPHPKRIDYEMVAWLLASSSSAEYLIQRMMSAENFVHAGPLLDFALERCTLDGLIMEFGVFRGASLRAIARRVTQEVHGFDSFEGLPRDWTYFQKQGRFSLQGQAPQFEEANIRVHQGWFDQTLPPFLAQHPGPARFIHIDCDIYASTRTVLELLKPRIVSGTVIVFDEYLNYPGWQQHEYRAFQEFVAQAGIAYRYIGFASSDYAVAVQVA